ncbi:DUF4421 family protein [Neolewinella antarctica]|uniref:DUF4421 domain-containing protein n=1 Tax=Neolewinella antarctica TaxID=442734 RepID=A0ABX0X725_9BACT|nr:DUF4421 family protein [Neolewinella antarctica]NJC25015.1 hypothetical protein [Neolewinella antarctica]
MLHPLSRRRTTARFVLFFWLCAASAPSFAQQWDTTYVQEQTARYRINGGFRVIDDLAEFTTPDGERFEIENRNLAFRIGGRYGIASYTFSIPISDLGTGTDEEQSGGWGLGLRLYRRYGYFRTQFRFTDGFRLTKNNGDGEFRSDIKLFTAYVYAYHLLNARRFSLRSSFNQRDRQLVSSGSFLLGGLITRRRFLADSLAISQEEGASLQLARFAQTNLGVGGGYSYTAIINKDFFITPLIYAGPELRFTNVQESGRGRMAENVRVGLQLRARLSVGYNVGRYFVALIGDFIPNTDKTATLTTRSSRSQLELRIGTQW